MPVQTIDWPVVWIASAIAYPLESEIPGMNWLSVRATWSNVLWSSLRTITRQCPPSPLPGPAVRGRSMVWAMPARIPVVRRDANRPRGALHSRPMGTLSRLFAPREREFFDLFEEAGANIARAGDLIERLLREWP